MGSLRKRCRTYHCPNLHSNRNGFCDECNARRNASYKHRKIMTAGTVLETRPLKQTERRSAQERGYGHDWQVFARRFLISHPNCAICGKSAKVVDHKEMTADVMMDMYGHFILDPELYQPLCVSCNLKKGRRGDVAYRQTYRKVKADFQTMQAKAGETDAYLDEDGEPIF